MRPNAEPYIEALGAKSMTVYYNIACAPAYIPNFQYCELVSARGRALSS